MLASLAGRTLRETVSTYEASCEADGASALGAGSDTPVGAAADPVGGVAGEWLRFAHRPADQGAQRRRDARLPRAFHPAARLCRASSCHSCSEQTVSWRLLSAMIASHAAEAAESVVV